MVSVQMERSVEIDEDFHGWLLEQASLLRNRNTLPLDWDHLAEELEAMAATDRRELLRRLTTLFEHLLKLSYQPGSTVQRGRGWRLTIMRSRTEISRLLDQSPGLKGQLDRFIAEAYSASRGIAGEACGLRRSQWEALFPEINPWTVEDALTLPLPDDPD
jgi:hypothetical protein